MKKNKKSLFDSVFLKSTTFVAAVAMTVAIATQFTSYVNSKNDIRERTYLMQKMNDELQYRISKQQKLLDSLSKEYIKDSIPNEILINEKLNSIAKRLELIEEQTKGLRQAINPLNPDEVLTIARLNDGLKVLNEKQNSSTQNSQARFDSFKTSILRELDASSKSINWLFLVLIPLVMNLLYSMWKDAKEKKSEKLKKNTEENSA